MIDIENQVFQIIAVALRNSVSGIYVTGEYVDQPPRFPAVSIVEIDNSVLISTQDSGNVEHDADVVYQVDVYSNKNIGKKAECKTIAGMIDREFANLGFTRMVMTPVQNMNNATIYRMTGRYRGVASKDSIIYRR